MIDDNQLLAEGLISRDTSWARDVANSGSQGFPWQASIGAEVINEEFVPSGSAANANGQTFDGPVYIVRASTLKEISFVDVGADSNTSARVAAKQAAKENTKNILFKETEKMKKTDDEKEKQTVVPETLQALSLIHI